VMVFLSHSNHMLYGKQDKWNSSFQERGRDWKREKWSFLTSSPYRPGLPWLPPLSPNTWTHIPWITPAAYWGCIPSITPVWSLYHYEIKLQGHLLCSSVSKKHRASDMKNLFPDLPYVLSQRSYFL
jgi:hypothetical protein